jgi:glycosyltransferase involved in cell wall biosynthesis
MTSRHGDVTVVVTNYNYARFLLEAVDSALRQDGGPAHVIVVDDGSTDPGTDDVLHALPAEVEVVLQSNSGLAHARNSGLHRADTPYLIVLDADDRLRPGALNALREPLDSDARLGFTYGLTHFFGDWDGEMTMPPYDPYKLLYRHMIGSTALFRRELLRDVGGFDRTFGGYEDWEFWLHALTYGWRGHRVDAVTFDYRRHGATMNSGARGDYHRWYRQLRRKHAALYARDRELARESGIGPLERAVYRWWWGARPLPAGLELRLQALVWKLRSRRPQGEV